ncbi:DgyrCDS76 [Dimorphilus gyrociliatus]|uniref:DgyrCDS76 n=1 Tax=Dimorphilus gyrociliatus TaxID=2664684 RepID=A0A7I8V3T0_9ANNE|nr:DgyrCDS76 [Dimorphilus gyrociliatus]
MFYQLLIALAFYSNILGAEADNGPTISEPPFDTYVGNDKAANLPCVVEGEQESTQTKYNITWYHNGKKVIFGPNKEKEGPFPLPKGGLFFIVVKRDDLGKYYCNVTDPKSKKWTVSKEITLGFADEITLSSSSTYRKTDGID